MYEMKDIRRMYVVVSFTDDNSEGQMIPLTKFQSAVLTSVLGLHIDEKGMAVVSTDREIFKKME